MMRAFLCTSEARDSLFARRCLQTEGTVSVVLKASVRCQAGRQVRYGTRSTEHCRQVVLHKRQHFAQPISTQPKPLDKLTIGMRSNHADASPNPISHLISHSMSQPTVSNSAALELLHDNTISTHSCIHTHITQESEQHSPTTD